MVVVEDRPEVSVVVLTALPQEYNAVRAHLEEPLDHVRGASGSVFEVGHLPGVPARIILGQSDEGNTATAVLAGEAIRLFLPRALFFVGVAGAIKGDLQLGDVVVAKQVDAVHGAKQQDGASLARPVTFPMAHELLQVAKHLVAVRSGWLDGADGGFRVHIKPIASGHVVLDDPTAPLAVELHEHYNDAVAIEMEGAGAAAAAHHSGTVKLLVVRGISDRADGRKHDADSAGWQATAAAHAAEVAFVIIENWVTGLEAESPPRGPAGTGRPEHQAVTPRQLPPAPAQFVGRVPELAQLGRLRCHGPRQCHRGDLGAGRGGRDREDDARGALGSPEPAAISGWAAVH